MRERSAATSPGLAEPSQRRVMRECRVGAPRADAALAAVKRSGFEPSKPARPLTLVPTNADTATTETDTSTVAGHNAPDTTAPDTPAPDTTDSDATEPTTPSAAPTGVTGEDGQVNPAAETPAGTPADAAAGTPVGASTNKATDKATNASTDVAATPVSASAVVRGRLPRWPMVLIAAGAFVAIWGGWVGLGELTGFGPIRLLPGIWDEFVINSAITLPIGMEAYAAFALRAWLAPPEAGLSRLARRFACWSALGALALGAAGQVAYHLMVAFGLTRAPWQITAFVSCLPVLVLACAAALTHLTQLTHRQEA